ncbi:hypothetical protein BX666DRAFT_1134659 [Dichotomocladium elegans]|nr:hypothetical protein BX666DRAFT_1134659 [Dichotomocladium elegans]
MGKRSVGVGRGFILFSCMVCALPSLSDAFLRVPILGIFLSSSVTRAPPSFCPLSIHRSTTAVYPRTEYPFLFFRPYRSLFFSIRILLSSIECQEFSQNFIHVAAVITSQIPRNMTWFGPARGMYHDCN